MGWIVWASSSVSGCSTRGQHHLTPAAVGGAWHGGPHPVLAGPGAAVRNGLADFCSVVAARLGRGRADTLWNAGTDTNGSLSCRVVACPAPVAPAPPVAPEPPQFTPVSPSQPEASVEWAAGLDGCDSTEKPGAGRKRLDSSIVLTAHLRSADLF